MRKRSFNVAEVYLEYLLLFSKIINHPLGIFPQLIASFHPGAYTKTKTNIGAVCKFKRTFISIKMTENAWNTCELWNGRIVRMNAYPHIILLSYRGYSMDKIFKVLPHFVYSIFFAM